MRKLLAKKFQLERIIIPEVYSLVETGNSWQRDVILGIIGMRRLMGYIPLHGSDDLRALPLS